MIALCHALPMECSVNKKTGSSFWQMGVIRIIMAYACAIFLNTVLPKMDEEYLYIGAETNSNFADVINTWVISQVKVAFMVFLIIYVLMIVQRLMEVYSLLPLISKYLAPLMRVFGLPREAAYMWLVGNVLGISYGSAVMLELQDKGLVTKEDANDVNFHLIMNHSMLEDTIVFATTGISVFWILFTRFLFAFILVWLRKAFMLMKTNK